jgi:hypothetical protein
MQLQILVSAATHERGATKLTAQSVLSLGRTLDASKELSDD